MKTHAIIPLFIPHKGCPNDCVFCNQRQITAHTHDITPKEVKKTIETWLTTLQHRPGMMTIEAAFYGGSFTGLPLAEQTALLMAAKPYKDAGLIQKLHLSTRPDYINEEILQNLKRCGVDVIELGVQSFDEAVLQAAGRGHHATCIAKSCRLIQDYGFTLGIQLMIGLPEDTAEKDVRSAKQAAALHPAIARLYPTVILPNTRLYTDWQAGRYQPLTEEEAVARTAAMYRILDAAGINIIRVGLKSSDLMDGGAAGGTFHPAFRQLVEGQIAKEDLETQLLSLYPHLQADGKQQLRYCPVVSFVSNPKSRNNLFGHRAANRKYFAHNYPGLNILWQTDEEVGISLPPGRYQVIDRGNAIDQIKHKGDK